jgi:hypothetical protein
MGRMIWATSFAFLAGLLIGILGLIIPIAASVAYHRANWSDSDRADEPYSVAIWSDLTTDECFPYLVAIGVIGALSCALGARNGLRSDARRWGPVCWGPLLLLLFPLIGFNRHRDAGYGALLFAVFMAPFV